VKQVGVTLAPHARRLVAALLARVVAARRALPPALAKPIARVSNESLLLALLAICIYVVGVVALLLLLTRGPREVTSTAGVESASALPPASAAPASASSSPSVELAASKDESLIALASTRASEGQDAEAVQLVARALTQHPSLRDDPRLATVLFRGAASETKETSDLAFGLLQGTMAARGAEVVYQLARDKGVREGVRKRAEKWLRSPEFSEHASGALQSAVKLRYAESCEKKHELLPLAGKVGTRQTLDVLRELEVTSGCGFSGHDDCYPCLRKDKQLSEAIARVQERLER
jgi:hypothetical protein